MPTRVTDPVAVLRKSSQIHGLHFGPCMKNLCRDAHNPNTGTIFNKTDELWQETRIKKREWGSALRSFPPNIFCNNKQAIDMLLFDLHFHANVNLYRKLEIPKKLETEQAPKTFHRNRASILSHRRSTRSRTPWMPISIWRTRPLTSTRPSYPASNGSAARASRPYSCSIRKVRLETD